MASKKDFSLTPSQYRVMRVLWQLGEGTAGDVLDAWDGRKKPAHTTVGTVLIRLEKRGLLRSKRRGRERVFHPLVGEFDVKQCMVSKLVDTAFAGDAQELLVHLVKKSDVMPDDLETMRRLLEEDSNLDSNR